MVGTGAVMIVGDPCPGCGTELEALARFNVDLVLADDDDLVAAPHEETFDPDDVLHCPACGEDYPDDEAETLGA